MAMLDVSCPSCGSKLKADEKMAGKKAKCKKCGTGFRIPGAKVGESLAEGQMLSTLGAPAPPLPGDDAGVAMAVPLDDEPPMAAPVAPPAPAPKPAEVAALPSADPFDFSKPAAPAAKPAAPPATQPAPPTAAPAKAAFGAAKSAPAAPVPPKPAAPPPPPPVAKAAPPAAKPAPPPAAEPEPVPEAAEVVDEDDNPFSFGGGGAAAAKKKGAKDDAPKKEKDADAKPKAEDAEPKPKKKAAPKPKADDDDDAPAVDPNNPFTLGALLDGPPAPPEPKKKKRGEEDDDEPKAKKKPKKDGEEGDADEDKPGYRRPEERGGKGVAVLITLVVGGLALALGGAAVVRYMKDKRADAEVIAEAKRKAEEEAKKKNEDPFAGNPPNPGGPDPKDKVDPKPKDKVDPKGKDKVDPKPKEKEVGPSGKAMLTVAKLKAVTVAPVGDKPKLTDGQKDRVELATPFAAVRRAFPRAKAGDDLYVLVQTNPGAGGTGELLALDTYSASGARDAAARIEFPGDSVPQPIADLISTPEGTFFLAGIVGNLHVWKVGTKEKVANNLDPYKEKPAHRAAGLAAAFFAPGGKQVVTVSTAGAVLLVDLASGKAVSEFVPPDGTALRVALGTGVTKAEGNGSIAVAVAGVVYVVKVAPGLEVARKLDLGGDVGQSLGVAVSSAGRVLYAFETNADGKKDKAVAVLPLDDKGKGPQFFAFPTGAVGATGKGAAFAGGTFAALVTDKGAVWFDDDDGKVVPLMATVPTAGAQFYGTDLHFIYVIPDPKAPAKSTFVAVSTDLNEREALKTNFPAKPLAALRADADGLSQ